MDKMIINISKGVSIFLMIAAGILTLAILAKGDTSIITEPQVQNNILNPFFYAAYIAFFICVAAAVIFPIIFMVSNPKSGINALIGIVVVAVICLLSWGISSSDIVGDVYEKFAITPSSSKLIGGSLIATYIFGAMAVVAAIYSEVSKMFK